MVFSHQTFISLASITGVIGFSSLFALNSAHAYSIHFNNGNFESGTGSDADFWNGAGDASRQTDYSNVSPSDTWQGVITTACPGTTQTGECLSDRNDDPATSASNYNKSGNDQISASVETVGNLQSILGLSDNALSIPREINGNPVNDTGGNPLLRTPKEGSAIYQDITVSSGGENNPFTLNFDWNFLTNDGASALGNQDFAFVSITGNGLEEVFILEDSTGDIPTVNPGATDFANSSTSSYATYISQELTLTSIDALTPGTYRVGFGVVDVDGTDRSSALLVDNFSVNEVPFEFSPSLGLLFMTGFFGINYFCHRHSREQNFYSSLL